MSILGSLLGGGNNRPEPSETMQNNTRGLMSNLNPFNLVSGIFGRKKSATDNYAGTKGGMRKGLKDSKKKDPKFVSKVARADVPPQKGESITDIAGKLYGLIRRNEEKKKKELQIEENFAKSFNEVKEKRNQQLIEALTKQPKGLKKETKKIKKESDKTKKEIQDLKKETPKGKGIEKPEIPKGAKPSPRAQPPTAAAPKGPTPSATPAPKGPTPSATPAPKGPTPSAPSSVPSAAIPTAAKIGIGAAGVIGMVNAQADELGVTNEYAKKAILANIQKESNFVPQSENLKAYANTSNKRIREIFTARANKYSDEELNQIKKDPYKFAEMVYGKDTKMGKSMGNTEEGDGFKYLGRGFIQVTGKNNYRELGKKLGIDLVSNPEKLNDPQIAARAAIVFVRDGLGKNKINSFKNQSEANREVTQTIGGRGLNLSKGYGAELLSKVEKYSSNLPEGSTSSSGKRLAETSTENKDLKKQQAAAAGGPVVVNQTNNVVASADNSKTMTVPRSDASTFARGAAT